MYPSNLFNFTVIFYTIMHGSIYPGLPGCVRVTGLNGFSVTLMEAQSSFIVWSPPCSDPHQTTASNYRVKNTYLFKMGHACCAGMREDWLSGAYISVARNNIQELTPEQINRIICESEVWCVLQRYDLKAGRNVVCCFPDNRNATGH